MVTSPLGTLWGIVPTCGDLNPILLQSEKSQSSIGAGVRGVLGCWPQVVGEGVRVSTSPLSLLTGLIQSSACLYLSFLSKGPWK